MEFIKDYVIKKLDSGELGYEVAEHLGTSVSMVSSYKNSGYNPSLKVAKFIYANENIVLHPFAEESLKLEIVKDN